VKRWTKFMGDSWDEAHRPDLRVDGRIPSTCHFG
jgi:hypothetical protein